jgi:hypothetical protein
MSKYDPLRQFLESRSAEQVPMTFADVERVLGFPLPPSAKAHPTWWSNNTGTHVGVRAWRDAGWKTSRVDVPGEKVVFVRAKGEPASKAPIRPGLFSVSPEQLSLAARKLLDDYAAESGGDTGVALARAVHEAAITRRRALIASFAAEAPRVSTDSVDLIREDRDAR